LAAADVFGRKRSGYEGVVDDLVLVTPGREPDYGAVGLSPGTRVAAENRQGGYRMVRQNKPEVRGEEFWSFLSWSSLDAIASNAFA
jgi:hypothetical protein